MLDGIGQLARGTGKLYKTFPSCTRMFLSSTTVTLKFKSPQELTDHLKLRNFTLLAYKGLHTTSLQFFHSECVSKQIRAACLYLTAFTMYTWSITGAPGAAGSSFTSSSEKGWCLVFSAQGIVYHCILVMTVLQTQ